MKCIPYIAAILLMAACTPDSGGGDLGPLPQVSFTAMPMQGKPNKIIVQNTTPATFQWRWFNGLGAASVGNRSKDTLTFAKKGEYVISLQAFGKGGFATASQKVVIANDAPKTEILKGGDMEAGANAHWTILNTGGMQTGIQFVNGKLVFTNTDAGSNGAIYQAVTVKKDVEYTFSANVKGSGATNTWFEVIIGTAVPEQGKDYSGNKFVSLNTWAGCGKVPFDGDIAEIGCDGSGTGKGGVIKFTTAGTIYIVIKAGSSGGTLGTGGIAMDNVKFLEEQL
ncbi:hypothetical protein [Chitinophaga deserti]|uniref:hypothetical protein n=1 Tax=Chitinophaga deserti TaxID=2164099 RepID=UPI0013009F6A|nr:hypothetical protein [Chitinophaga deserti]